MKKTTLHPKQVLRAGEDGTVLRILCQYLSKHIVGRSDDLTPAFVIANEPASIKKNLEHKARERIVLREKDCLRHRAYGFGCGPLRRIEDYQQIDEIIPITRDPNSRDYTGKSFLEVLMRSFGFSGNYDIFIEKYLAGDFHPLYIHPDILYYEGETDIVKTCGEDNRRLTLGFVLTKQLYEKKREESLKEREKEISAEVERNFFEFQDVEPLMKRYLDQGVNYMLVDGNHRALAAALSGNSIDVFVLASDDDIEEAIQIAEVGDIRDFHWRERILDDTRISLYRFYAHNIDSVSTVQELASQLLD